jgi:hypothetical protein
MNWFFYLTCCCGCVGGCLICGGRKWHRRSTQARQLEQSRSLSQRELDAPDAAGWTALHYAVWNDQPRVIAGLLEAGANPNAIGRVGEMRVNPETSQLDWHTVDEQDVPPAGRFRPTPLHLLFLMPAVPRVKDLQALFQCGADLDQAGCLMTPRGLFEFYVQSEPVPGRKAVLKSFLGLILTLQRVSVSVRWARLLEQLSPVLFEAPVLFPPPLIVLAASYVQRQPEKPTAPLVEPEPAL